MGILGTLIGTALIGLGTRWFTRSEVSPDERKAVFALIDDLRTTPLYLTMFYERPHAFIDEHWRKGSEGDGYLESQEERVSVFDLANAVGRHHDALGLLDPKYGVKTGKVTDMDRTKDQEGGLHIRATLAVSDPQKPADLDLPGVRLFSTGPRLLPQRLTQHLADLNLPGSIRRALEGLSGVGEVASFKKVSANGADFLLVSNETRLGPEGPINHFPEETPLYLQRTSALALVSASEGLADALDEWADRYSVDLGALSRRSYDRAYKEAARSK